MRRGDRRLEGVLEVLFGIVVGLVLLVVGGELLVRGATSAARALGVSPLLIGLTLVGFGTSTPELVTSVTAALEGSPGIAVGNVVGSNIANILLILGIAAIIYPMAVNPKGFKRDAIVLVLAALACLGVTLFGHINRLLGVAFVAALVAYVIYVYLQEKNQPDEQGEVKEHMAEAARPGPKAIALSLGMAVVGIAVTIFGARFLVDGAISLASGLGVSDTIIGLTIVAVGTSMPELVTSVMAALKKQADVAYGNIIGSNIYNVLGILGVTAIISPIDVPQQIAAVDIWVMLGATALLVFFARSGFKLMRWEGMAFVACYVAYTGWLISIA
jgi:cation:H+ antiporter